MNKTIPLFLTTIPAGFPSPADDYIESALDLNELMIRHPLATFFVKVAGDSMEGAGILPGDMLVVDRAEEPASGKIVVAVVQGEFTVKRLLKKGSSLYLVAENKHYPPLKITPEMEFQVWGVVMWVIHKAV